MGGVGVREKENHHFGGIKSGSELLRQCGSEGSNYGSEGCPRMVLLLT